jgi:aminoglycoside 6-adenylyltransferase
MRTPEEVMDAILDFARQNDNIRIVGMEGSRVNRNIPMDSFQDFDVTYFVTNPGQLTGDDGWLSRFGKIIMMQKPEDMELYPPEEEGYSYLMIFEDYVKIDLTILEESQIAGYLEQDRLRTRQSGVLLA